MRQLFLCLFALFLASTSLVAQRKEISQARSYIKSGKDFDKAEKLMEDLLAKDSANQSNPDIHTLLFQAVLKQYEAGNERLYLQQQYDTAALFRLTQKMFRISATLDSLENAGRQKPSSRSRKRAAELATYRPNLYNGGAFFITKGDFATAYSFFDSYMACAWQPAFQSFDYEQTDKLMPRAAYWAAYCAYKTKDPVNVLRCADIAESDTSKLRHLLTYKAEAYAMTGDSMAYRATLQRGLALYPRSHYFFTHLVDHFTACSLPDSAIAVCDRSLAADSLNPLYLFAKSTILLNVGRYAESKSVSDKIIAQCDTLAEPYYNAATALLNQALELEAVDAQNRQRSLIRDIYEQARPYMERYRTLAPDQRRKWGPALYRIYLKLNLGTQFDKMDALLNEN